MDAELKQLIRRRGSIKQKLTTFIKFFNPVNDSFKAEGSIPEKTMSELQLRVEKLSDVITEFEECQMEIEISIDDDHLEEQYVERETFTNSHAKYLSEANLVIGKMQGDALSEHSSNMQPQGPVNQYLNSSGLRLPPINLPKFNGELSNWLEFKDTFESLIHHSDNITNIQRYHYLRASLGPQPLKIIQSLEFSAANYTIAWDLLCGRYDNSRLLVNNHIKSLFALEHLNKESATGLRDLIDNVNKHLRALKSLQLPTEHFFLVLVIYIVSTKLDKVTAREWEKQKVSEHELPTWDEFNTFVKNRADFLLTVETNTVFKSGSRLKETERDFHKLSLLTQSSNCGICNSVHKLYQCEKFLSLSVKERWDTIKKLKVCTNCLNKGHFVKHCKFRCCTKCNESHNSLLHNDRLQSQGPSSSPTQQDTQTSLLNSVPEIQTESNNNGEVVTLSSSATSDNNNYVLLSTAMVFVFDQSGKAYKTKAVLDSGSQSSFVSEHLCSLLKLRKTKMQISVSGINNASSIINSKCEFSIGSIYNTFKTPISCFVVPKITDNLPLYLFDISQWKIPENVQLADPEFNVPIPVDLLIGANLFWNLLRDGKITLGKNLPVLNNSLLGFLVSGQIPYLVNNDHHCFFISNQALYDDLQRFWSVEEIDPVHIISKDDSICEKFFKENVSRSPDGKFIVRIPIKGDVSSLANTKELALKRMLNLERRFCLNEEFMQRYISFMEEYVSLGHMPLVSSQEEPLTSYFLPHHGVVRENSSTTKLRVVFDGSAKLGSGASLNDIQYAGPSIQNNIFDILLRFRQHPVVVTSDIAKMYRCVLVHPEDRHLQKVVWRNDPNDKMSIYELNTVTYGTASAPYLAMRCLRQLAFENQHCYPEACQIILDNFYVDDLLTGFKDPQHAKEICGQICKILQSAGFVLRKWSSNNKYLLERLQEHSEGSSVLTLSNNNRQKTLGIQWVSSLDILCYDIPETLNGSVTTTKRSVLSELAKIFDPLGLVSPCTIYVKILIQRLWSLKLNWDQGIPSDLEINWLSFRRQLPILNKLRIPRYVLCSQPVKKELHCFCDASQSAYSAAIYMRSIDELGNKYVYLLCAKTKVAPLKVLSIPRLELCGTLLLSRLSKSVLSALKENIDCFFWCDSQIVLYWINTEPKLLQVFVGNRVAEVQAITDITRWAYINTRSNAADIATRGMLPEELYSCELWWNGPSFLYNDSEWPEPMEFLSNRNIPELRKGCQVSLLNSHSNFDIFERFSDLHKLVRVFAYVRRFLLNSKAKKDDRQSGPLTNLEIDHSLTTLVKIAQRESFMETVLQLQSTHTIKANHRLISLSPFLDENDLLRVGGRLKYSSLRYDAKHPFLLDGKHKLTFLIFRSEHLRLLHAGPQLLLSSVRQRFWATSGMQIAKSVVRKCIRCFKFKPISVNPVMADLPSSRITVSSPFTVCGVDYAGPYVLKDRKGRGSKTFKAYLCIFICFATKAIHLEVATDLTAQNFIAVLRRFCARRGTPSHIYSDNGSNFVGAQRELRVLYQFFLNSGNDISKHCTDKNIVWHFIPPNSPTFGGLWESNIKQAKHHLSRVIGDNVLTLDEFYTVLTQVEAVLNSRPLYPLSNDPNDLLPLTPFHFLIGKCINILPGPTFEENVKINRLTRYQLVQKLSQDFWKSWSKHYLCTLQHKSKWKQSTRNIQIGELVLLRNENLPPYKWVLGRVTELHPGEDQVVRVVTVRTTTGVLKRAVNRICPFPDEL